MKETYKNNEDENFPLQKNIPLPPGDAVRTLGDFGRQFKMSQENKSDFPCKVLVKRKDGIEIKATLEKLYCDQASQADGTFYFSDNVRENFQPGNKNNYLFGNEIESITFL